ncbi:glycosyltransferase [Sulfolobus tengchongensis]|uniref:Glycosyltransferase n=1 Tax=Sulfolobus tengchongensis TaxID=207809 RepID=A0AAX4L3Z8_9CREN
MTRLLYVNFGHPAISGATTTVVELMTRLPNMGVKVDLIEVLSKDEKGLLDTYPELNDKINLISLVRLPTNNNLIGRTIRQIYRSSILRAKIRKMIDNYDFIIGFDTRKTIHMIYSEPYIMFPLYKFYLELIKMTNLIDGTAWFINSIKVIRKFKSSKLNICAGKILQELLGTKYNIYCKALEPPAGVDLNLIRNVEPYSYQFDAIHVSRQGFIKGTPEAIQVMRMLEKQGYSRFALIGSQDYGFDLNRYLMNKDNIKYFGEIIDKRVMYSILKSAKVFIYPTHADSFGIVVAEALACGVPVVAYDIPAMRYYYGDCKSVKLVKEGDVKQMFLEVLEIFKDYDYYKALAEECASKYSWDKVAESFLNILKDLQQKFS